MKMLPARRVGRALLALLTAALCTTSHADGYTGGLGAGGYTELTVTVTGALLANENRVVVLTDAASQQGQQIWGYVSADNTVNVVYYNPRGGAFTLAAHTLHVYVYPGPMASPT